MCPKEKCQSEYCCGTNVVTNITCGLSDNSLNEKCHSENCFCLFKVRAVEEILKQTEEDADKEILELKTKYEKLLRTEREANVRMRGESGIVKKKLQTLVSWHELILCRRTSIVA